MKKNRLLLLLAFIMGYLHSDVATFNALKSLQMHLNVLEESVKRIGKPIKREKVESEKKLKIDFLIRPLRNEIRDRLNQMLIDVEAKKAAIGIIKKTKKALDIALKNKFIAEEEFEDDKIFFTGALKTIKDLGYYNMLDNKHKKDWQEVYDGFGGALFFG